MAINDPSVGVRLKTLREAYGLSQRELAKRAGITNSNISMIEQDQVSPSIQSLARILGAFPISLADFFTWNPMASGAHVYPASALQQDQCLDATGAVIQTVAYSNTGRQLAMKRWLFAPGVVTGPTLSTLEWCGVVTEGRVQLVVGTQRHELCLDDGFYIPCGVLYRFSNTSAEPASLLSCSAFALGNAEHI